jgi:hypothetical protein
LSKQLIEPQRPHGIVSKRHGTTVTVYLPASRCEEGESRGTDDRALVLLLIIGPQLGCDRLARCLVLARAALMLLMAAHFLFIMFQISIDPTSHTAVRTRDHRPYRAAGRGVLWLTRLVAKI